MNPLNRATPFILLDDARVDGAVAARLYRTPLATLTAHSVEDIVPLLDQLAQWQASGSHCAGYLSYDAGMALEPRLAGHRTTTATPLAWFGRFAAVERIAADAVPDLLPDAAGAVIGAPQPTVDQPSYETSIAAVLAHIQAGDIYQANFTFAAHVALHGDPLSAYARLRDRARAGYGGIVWTGTHWLLSFSPELFFSLRDRQVLARPMKGTATRARDPAADATARAKLAADPKQRAENLMIVDLIRNDLSRLATPGSVSVPSLFRVETYPTVHQMVSDVAATLPDGTGAVDVLRSAFPCGSITGAPKIRAMQIIDALEAAPRGAYTGSIGFIAPDGEAAFNVAIRTLALRDGDAFATLGLGSGIVADSIPGAEWRECLAKGAFVSGGGATFDLIETMGFDPHEGIRLLDRHLARLGASARTFGFTFDRHAIRNQLQHATFLQREPARIRLRLSLRGVTAVLVEPMPLAPAEPVRCAIAPLSVPADDIRLAHKTSDRAFYDQPRIESGAFEILFTNPDGALTEGSFTSIFVERDGQLLTPPASIGLLPGVLRAELLASGKAIDALLTPADLTGGFFIGNAVRGLIRATL
jgi:para-aminobenzoate synthetase/4-amino-4-deoxychorismate lyase